MTINDAARLRETGLDARQRRDIIARMDGVHKTVGAVAFWALPSERENQRLHALPGWPACACTAWNCDCDDPATTTDDGGVAVCEVCAQYVIDADGQVHCAQCDDVEVEIVTESCGAGHQTHSYARIKPATKMETNTMTTKIEWNNCYAADFEGVLPAIEIKDDCETYCATLGNMTPEQAVEEFVRTYDYNDSGTEAELRAVLHFRVIEQTYIVICRNDRPGATWQVPWAADMVGQNEPRSYALCEADIAAFIRGESGPEFSTDEDDYKIVEAGDLVPEV
ncbi:MAG: hypothetical protein WA766_14560 [Candidatus Acidiferrales bacterium]